ncbi:hypothetical protein CRUP_020770, partial [Coryphaenoides rupestris]
MVMDARIWVLFKCHWQQTMTYWSVFFSFGLCVAFLGPTVQDLRCQTRSTLQQITWVFFAQQLFLLLGSAVGGLWKRTHASSLYALFSSTLVISVVPLVADPFLSDGGCALGPNLTANGTSPASSGSPQHLYISLGNASLEPLHSQDSGGSQLPVPLAVFLLLYHERLLPCSRTSDRLLDRDHSVSPSLRGRPLSFFLLHALGGAILFITDGIIGSYAGFVYTYAVSPPLEMGHQSAGCLDSVFWAAVTAGRLAFIYLSYRFHAAHLLILSL